MTSVSVAMATYNGARYLREQLASIAAQTAPPAELVVTDDASNDDTAAIVEAFAATAAFPVRLHRNPARLGFRANFMRAVGLCASDLIALCDQDDVWDPGKLARIARAFDDPDVLLAYHEAWLIDADGRRGGLADILRLSAHSLPLTPPPMRNPYGFAMVFRRDLGGFADLWALSTDNLAIDQPMAHDQWFFFLASVFGAIAFVEEPLAGYRLHGGNTWGLERPRRSLRGKAAAWLAETAGEHRSFAVAAAARATVLAAARERLDGVWASRAQEAAEHYTDLSRRCAERAAVFLSKGPRARLRAWVDTLRDGGYSSRTRWSFGGGAALADLVCLMIPRPVVARLLPDPAALPRR